VGLEGELGHGSGRAPDGFPLYTALQRVSGLLDKFGGHNAAVGFSVRADRIQALREAFDEACAELWSERSVECEIAVDARFGDHGYRLPRAPELSLLEPLGEDNPEPVFEVEGQVARADVVGDGHLKIHVRVGERELAAFGYELAAHKPELAAPVRVYGHLRPDGYRGGDAVELRILDLAPISR
jgi:single-stranded-DNA-specific exonuclease